MNHFSYSLTIVQINIFEEPQNIFPKQNPRPQTIEPAPPPPPPHWAEETQDTGRFRQVCNWGGQLQNFSMYLLQILEFLSSQLISIVNMSETQNLRTMSQNN